MHHTHTHFGLSQPNGLPSILPFPPRVAGASRDALNSPLMSAKQRPFGANASHRHSSDLCTGLLEIQDSEIERRDLGCGGLGSCSQMRAMLLIHMRAHCPFGRSFNFPPPFSTEFLDEKCPLVRRTLRTSIWEAWTGVRRAVGAGVSYTFFGCIHRDSAPCFRYAVPDKARQTSLLLLLLQSKTSHQHRRGKTQLLGGLWVSFIPFGLTSPNVMAHKHNATNLAAPT